MDVVTVALDWELARFEVVNHCRSQPVAKIWIYQKVLSSSENNRTIAVKLRNHRQHDRLDRHPTPTSFQRLALSQRNRCSFRGHSLVGTRKTGVADLWYERLNLQKMKQARQNIFGISNLSIFIPWFSNAEKLTPAKLLQLTNHPHDSLHRITPFFPTEIFISLWFYTEALRSNLVYECFL